MPEEAQFMAISAFLLVLSTTAAATGPVFPATDDPNEKVRCVREKVTGSLIQSRKVCHTEKEWRRIRNDAESEARRITQPGTLNERNGG
jgi:hypothetical protein